MPLISPFFFAGGPFSFVITAAEVGYSEAVRAPARTLGDRSVLLLLLPEALAGYNPWSKVTSVQNIHLLHSTVSSLLLLRCRSAVVGFPSTSATTLNKVTAAESEH